MTVLKFLTAITILTCFACSEKTTSNSAKENLQSVDYSEGRNKICRPLKEVESIIFGNYCGESDNSTWVNRYQLYIKDTVSLMVDTMHKKTSIDTFAYMTHLSDKRRINAAIDLFNKVPKQLFQDTIKNQRFSCKDCPHFCTLFFVLKTKTGDRKVYFAYETENTTPEVEDFRKALDTTINYMLQDGMANR